MNINRAGKQQRASWRAEAKWEGKLLREKLDWETIQQSIRGHAAGWIAGVAWCKRQRRKQ